MKTDEMKLSCIVVHLADNAVHVTRCLTQMTGEDNIFPPDVPLSEVRKSLSCKVRPETVEMLCGMWEDIRAHLAIEGGEVYVHGDRVEVSNPKGARLIKPMARSAAI